MKPLGRWRDALSRFGARRGTAILVVGPTRIDLVRLARGRAEPTLELVGTEWVPGASPEPGPPELPQLPAGFEALVARARAEESLLPGALVHVVVERPLAWTKVVSLATMRRRRYKALLQLNAHRFLPVAIGEAAISASVLGRTDPGTRDILLTAVSRRVVESIESSLQHHELTLGRVLAAPAARYVGLQGRLTRRNDADGLEEAGAKMAVGETVILDSSLRPKMFLPYAAFVRPSKLQHKEAEEAAETGELNAAEVLENSLRATLGPNLADHLAVNLTPGTTGNQLSPVLTALGIPELEPVIPETLVSDSQLVLCAIGVSLRRSWRLTVRSATRAAHELRVHRRRVATSVAASIVLAVAASALYGLDVRRELDGIELAREAIAEEVRIASGAASTLVNLNSLLAEVGRVEARKSKPAEVLTYLATQMVPPTYLTQLDFSDDTVRMVGIGAVPEMALYLSVPAGDAIENPSDQDGDTRQAFSAVFVLPLRPLVEASR